jgi:serine/threonine-protein kinase RsbW
MTGVSHPVSYLEASVRRIASDVHRLELRLDPSAESVRQARHEVAAFAERHDLANPDDVALAVSEAATNAVVHAYRTDDDHGDVRVVACAEETGLVVVIRDYGVGMSPNPDSPGPGLGLSVIGAIAAELNIERPDTGGTRIRIRFARERRQAA